MNDNQIVRHKLADKINELIEAYENIDNAFRQYYTELRNKVDALVEENNIHEEEIDELQMRIDPPSTYQVMQEKDTIIAKHIGEKNRLQQALDLAIDWLEQVATLAKCDDDLCREFTKRKLAEIKQITGAKE